MDHIETAFRFPSQRTARGWCGRSSSSMQPTPRSRASCGRRSITVETHSRLPAPLHCPNQFAVMVPPCRCAALTAAVVPRRPSPTFKLPCWCFLADLARQSPAAAAEAQGKAGSPPPHAAAPQPKASVFDRVGAHLQVMDLEAAAVARGVLDRDVSAALKQAATDCAGAESR